MTRAQQARAARGQVERAFDRNGWQWNARLSRWVDLLVMIEERERLPHLGQLERIIRR